MAVMSFMIHGAARSYQFHLGGEVLKNQVCRQISRSPFPSPIRRAHRFYSSLFDPETRIHPLIQNVRYKINDHDPGGEYDHDGLHHRIVPVADG